MFRRKRMPPELEPALTSFRETLVHVEAAKEAVVAAVPTARMPGRPLADALFDYEEHLGTAEDIMPGWRVGPLVEEWTECNAALERTRRTAESLRLESGDMPFDALAFAIQDLIAPLEAFESAAQRFRSLRR